MLIAGVAPGPYEPGYAACTCHASREEHGRAAAAAHQLQLWGTVPEGFQPQVAEGVVVTRLTTMASDNTDMQKWEMLLSDGSVEFIYTSGGASPWEAVLQIRRSRSTGDEHDHD
jgi:hypothetical protein